MIGLPATGWICAGVLLIGLATGWQLRALQCDADLAAYQQRQQHQAEAQRALKAQAEAAQAAATAHSTQRLDTQQAAQQKETVYVEKEVIRYRDRYRTAACQRPAEWLQLYNDSLFGPVGAVSATR